MSNVYTSEELATMAVVSNTEANFESISDTIVPANTIYYSVDTNMARVGDGSTTWGALVPFLYGENLNVNVVQKIKGPYLGFTLPTEDTVPSTAAVDEALTELKSVVDSNLSSEVIELTKIIESNKATADTKFKSIDSNIADLGELATDISQVNTRLVNVENNLKTDSVDSAIYKVNDSISSLNRDLNTLSGTVSTMKAVTDKVKYPVPVSQGGTGVTTNAALTTLIEGLGFQLKTSGSGSSTTAEYSKRLSSPREIKVYTYTSGAGNITSSKLYNMSGAANFDGSSNISIGLLSATYTNCNCRCDDDY